jgi:hypothetical protein
MGNTVRVELNDDQATLFCMFCSEEVLLATYTEAVREGNIENEVFLQEFIQRRGIQLTEHC